MRQGIVVTGLLGIVVAATMVFMGGQSLFSMPRSSAVVAAVTRDARPFWLPAHPGGTHAAPSAAATDTLGVLRLLATGVARLDFGKHAAGEDGFAVFAHHALAAAKSYFPFAAAYAPATVDTGTTLTAMVDEPETASDSATLEPAADVRALVGPQSLPAAREPPAALAAADAAEFERTSVAAGKGDRDAAYRLGILYRDGRGVARDPAAAAKWLLASANDGNTLAARAVGELYEDGIGVARDSAAAFAWLDRAATHSVDIINRDIAVRERDGIAAAMTPPELSAARKLRLSDQSPATGDHPSGLTTIAG